MTYIHTSGTGGDNGAFDAYLGSCFGFCHSCVDKCPCRRPGTSSLCLEPETAKIGFGGSKDSDQSTGRKCAPGGEASPGAKLCTWRWVADETQSNGRN